MIGTAGWRSRSHSGHAGPTSGRRARGACPRLTIAPLRPAFPRLGLQYSDEPPYRVAGAIRAIFQLAMDLLQGSLQHKETDEGHHVLVFLGVGGGAARALGVTFEETYPGAFSPGLGQGLECLGALRALGAEVRE